MDNNAYTRFHTGDKVALVIPYSDRAGSIEIREFNRHQFTISKVKRTKLGYIYELEGVKSKMGIPFSFMAEWLLPVEE